MGKEIVGSIKVSFDGIRWNTTSKFNDLVHQIVNDHELFNITSEIQDKIDEVGRQICLLNGLYVESIEDDFNPIEDIEVNLMSEIELLKCHKCGRDYYVDQYGECTCKNECGHPDGDYSYTCGEWRCKCKEGE